ncbi:hypothetical protein [Polaromonas sp. OV174]|uniref:hypothetical protein n=1 Tax=Polaromonas sp. OV174 TaxID=1855300 RepID=UPI0015A56B12
MQPPPTLGRRSFSTSAFGVAVAVAGAAVMVMAVAATVVVAMAAAIVKRLLARSHLAGTAAH